MRLGPELAGDVRTGPLSTLINNSVAHCELRNVISEWKMKDNSWMAWSLIQVNLNICKCNYCKAELTLTFPEYMLHCHSTYAELLPCSVLNYDVTPPLSSQCCRNSCSPFYNKHDILKDCFLRCRSRISMQSLVHKANSSVCFYECIKKDG